MTKNILNNFKDQLGEYCAVNQFVELTKRVFLKDYFYDPNGEREKLQTIAQHHNLTLTNYDLNKASHRIALNYITNTHLCLEAYLKALNEKIRKYIDPTFHKEDDESWIKHVSKKVLTNEQQRNNEKHIALCEYYRLVRNHGVHHLKGLKELTNSFEKLSNLNLKEDDFFSRLQAPNPFEAIQFDDFVLFARSCGEIADVLYVNLSFNYEEFAEDIAKNIGAKISRQKNKGEANAKKILYNYLVTNFRDNGKLLERIDGIYDLIVARRSNG